MRKMVVRGDDYGYTNVCNIGSFEAIENGVVTSADVMLDCPGTEDALMRLKELPWISVGWHTHMWGTPILPPEQVPTLVDRNGRFRPNVRIKQDVNEEEAFCEACAELDRCLDILGRVPDTANMNRGYSPYAKAILRACDRYGIAHNFYSKHDRSGISVPDARWENRKIYIGDPTIAYADLQTDSIAQVDHNYDPVKYYTENRGEWTTLPEDAIFIQAWHPGYVDYFVYAQGERGENDLQRDNIRHFIVCRPMDMNAMVSPMLKQWIHDNHIMLINQRDALYGTNEYQNHLRRIGSDLFMGE